MLLDRQADVFLAKRSDADGWVVKPLDAFSLRRAATAILAGDDDTTVEADLGPEPGHRRPRRARRRPRSSGTEVPDRPAAPVAEPFDAELVGALRQLTADQREVVALRFVADLPLDDVARMTRRSVGATKALQHRALENLRQSVSAEPPTAL